MVSVELVIEILIGIILALALFILRNISKNQDTVAKTLTNHIGNRTIHPESEETKEIRQSLKEFRKQINDHEKDRKLHFNGALVRKIEEIFEAKFDSLKVELDALRQELRRRNES